MKIFPPIILKKSIYQNYKTTPIILLTLHSVFLLYGKDL